MSDQFDWPAIAAALRAPFDPAEVDFRPQGKLGSDGKGRVVAYIDARNVMDRLDAVVGPQNWEPQYQVCVQDAKAIRVVLCTLLVYGVPKPDVGDAGDIEPSKSAISDALKRAGVVWGIGRYLYGINLPRVTGERVTGGKDDDNWRIPDGAYTLLRSKLPRPANSARPAVDTGTGEILEETAPAQTPATAHERAAVPRDRQEGRPSTPPPEGRDHINERIGAALKRPALGLADAERRPLVRFLTKGKPTADLTTTELAQIAARAEALTAADVGRWREVQARQTAPADEDLEQHLDDRAHAPGRPSKQPVAAG